MTSIEALCPSCGVVRVASQRFRLVVYPQRPASNFCEFRCDCDELVMLYASPVVVAALWHVIDSRVEHIPEEALEPRKGSALTEDDFIDFMLEMSRLP